MQSWFDYQSRQYRYLFEITRAIASRLDLDTVLEKALRYAVELVGGGAGLIALKEADNSFQFAARFGIESQLLGRMTPLLTEIPPTIQPDASPRWRFPELEIRLAGILDRDAARLQHVMAIPLIVPANLLGVIYVFRSWHEAAFTTMDEDALAVFSDHVAIAIDHARLYTETTRYARELGTVIEGSGHGLFIADPNGKIRSVNRAFENVTGCSRKEAFGQDYHSVLKLTASGRKAIDLPPIPPGTRQPVVSEGTIQRRDATQGAYIQISLAPLYDDERQLFSIVGNVVDLSAFRETDQLKTTFLAGISHDLKTPLALIRGYAETLRRTDVTWDRKTVDDSLAIIQDEAEYLTCLVNALLDAAQLERGNLPLHTGTIRIDELARRIVERFQSVDSAHRWGTEFPSDYPLVNADSERLREVLQNLINNAIKYIPTGTLITVGGWIEASFVGIFVRDEGPGIPIQEQEHIFDRFTRGQARVAQRTQGAGLGLYLCRAIVESHGGRIWMENLPERGAAFYFALPRKETQMVATAADAASEGTSSGSIENTNGT